MDARSLCIDARPQIIALYDLVARCALCASSEYCRIGMDCEMARSAKSVKPEQKRGYLKQTDVPGASLEDALRIPRAILDHHAGQAISPLYVAKALDIDPKGSHFRVLSGAAIAFGLIDGGAQAASISLTDLARRVLRPKVEGGEILAMREAVLRPRIFGEFLQRYDGHAFPRQDIACNVVEDMDVPRDKTTEVFERLEASAVPWAFWKRSRESYM